MKNKQSKPRIFLPLLVLALAASAVSYTFKLNLAVSAVLFWGLPAVYLTVLAKTHKLRLVLLFSTVTTLTAGLVIGFLSKANHVWYTQHFAFPIGVYGPVSLDDCVWLFLYVFMVLMLFEVLAKHNNIKPTARRFYPALFVTSVCMLVVHLIITLAPKWVSNIPYMYLSFEILFLAVALIFTLKHYHRYRNSLFKVVLYVMPVAFLNEVVALKQGLWYFPDNAELLGRVAVLGVRVPVEEIAFFVISPLAILAFYIYFFREADRSLRSLRLVRV